MFLLLPCFIVILLPVTSFVIPLNQSIRFSDLAFSSIAIEAAQTSFNLRLASLIICIVFAILFLVHLLCQEPLSLLLLLLELDQFLLDFVNDRFALLENLEVLDERLHS